MIYKILVIDDHAEGFVKELEQYADKLDGKCLEFIPLKETDRVLSRITTMQPDAVLLDICMPDKKGMLSEKIGRETLKKIKANYPHMPVVMLTGKFGDSTADISLGDYYQADAFLHKAKDISSDDTILAEQLESTIAYHNHCECGENILENNFNYIMWILDNFPYAKMAERPVFIFDGKVGTGRHLGALLVRKYLNEENQQVNKEQSLIIEINCLFLERDGTQKNLVETNFVSKGNVILLRHLDKTPDEFKSELKKLIVAWRDKAWIVVAADDDIDVNFWFRKDNTNVNVYHVSQSMQRAIDEYSRDKSKYDEPDFPIDIDVVRLDFTTLNAKLLSFDSGNKMKEFFKKLCEACIKSLGQRELLNSGVKLREDTLELLILHDWSNGNILELEEVLSKCIDKVQSHVSICPEHIQYDRYQNPGDCQSAHDILKYDDKVRHKMIKNYTLKNSRDLVYELVTRFYIKKIHMDDKYLEPKQLSLELAGMTYESLRQVKGVFGHFGEKRKALNKE